MRFLEYISSLMWGGFGSAVLLGGSLFLLVKLKAFYVVHPIKTIRTASSYGGISAMLTALGGCIGVGNIVGVGIALSAGGAGAVFWMWICALMTAVLKYSEIYLAVKFKDGKSGGPMKYLRFCGAPFLAEIFCALCIISSFGIGCSAQSNAVALSAKHIGISSPLIGAILTFLCLITLLGGGKALRRVCGVTVPIMGVLYSLGCVVIIALNITKLPSVFANIIESAMSFKSAAGGISASLFMRGLREGMSKGIFSAESGMGSSSITYSFECNESAESQGVWGILEVFFDTVVMCSLTAFVLLVTKSGDVFSAFGSYYGSLGEYFTFISLFCFAYTSICCWSFYSTSCIRALTNKKRALVIYGALFSICIYLGAVSDTSGVFLVSDVSNALMLFVNFYGMLKLYREIKSPL